MKTEHSYKPLALGISTIQSIATMIILPLCINAIRSLIHALTMRGCMSSSLWGVESGKVVSSEATSNEPRDLGEPIPLNPQLEARNINSMRAPGIGYVLQQLSWRKDPPGRKSSSLIF
jgi:hypothetical protein